MPVRYTRKDGKPSSYEFSCGSFYEKKVNDNRVQIYKEYLTFHIFTFIAENKTSFGGKGEYSFQSADNLKEAWKIFNAELKHIKSIKE